jgi:hypothetical protein
LRLGQLSRRACDRLGRSGGFASLPPSLVPPIPRAPGRPHPTRDLARANALHQQHHSPTAPTF